MAGSSSTTTMRAFGIGHPGSVQPAVRGAQIKDDAGAIHQTDAFRHHRARTAAGYFFAAAANTTSNTPDSIVFAPAFNGSRAMISEGLMNSSLALNLSPLKYNWVTRLA